jgi:hypothetical protein
MPAVSLRGYGLRRVVQPAAIMRNTSNAYKCREQRCHLHFASGAAGGTQLLHIEVPNANVKQQ